MDGYIEWLVYIGAMEAPGTPLQVIPSTFILVLMSVLYLVTIWGFAWCFIQFVCRPLFGRARVWGYVLLGDFEKAREVSRGY